MVQTRNQYRRWIEQQEDDQDLMNMIPSQQSSLGFLSQRSSQGLPSLSSIMSGIPPASFPTQSESMYRPRDIHKKHRLPDDSPYVTNVVSHKRRTPK